MKRRLSLLLALALSLSLLGGCGRKEAAEPDVSPAPAASSEQTEQPESPENPSETDKTEETVPVEPDSGADPEPPAPDVSQPEPPLPPDGGSTLSLEEEDRNARQLYAQVLTRLLEENKFPDGSDDGFDPASYTMSDNKFAIYDVDLDGREELVIKFLAAPVSGHRGFVLDVDPATGALRTQMEEYPAMAFFENGSVLVHWSHNQGKGGAFWPYSIYVYRPELDSYSFVGSVDAWDKTIDTLNYPQEVDVSDTGFVYYLYTTGPTEEAAPVDALTYQEWLTPYLGDAQLVTLDYQDLTAEAIRQITSDVIRETEPSAP